MTEQTTVAILNQYPKEKYNVIAPETMTQITPWHRIIVSQVRIDPDPQRHEVYPVRSGMLALHKTSLLRIADAAGVRFRPTKFQRDGEDGSYEAFAIAEKQDPDGTWRQYPGSYRWDVTERLAQVKDPNTAAGIEEAKMIRKFSMQRAESGAMSRAIRAIIQLEQAYKPADLLKPFIVARVTFNPWDDPQVKGLFVQALAAKLAGNVAMLRGPDTDDPFGLDSTGEAEHRAVIQSGNQAGEVLQLMGASGPEDGSEWADELFMAGEDTPAPIVVTTPKAEPKPEPQPEQPKPAAGRPLDADALRQVLRKKAHWQGDTRKLDGEPITEKQVPYTATLMDELFPNLANDLKQKARHDVLGYVFGVDSTKLLTKAEASALIDWMQDKASATVEAARIIEAIAMDAGQIGLPL